MQRATGVFLPYWLSLYCRHILSSTPVNVTGTKAKCFALWSLVGEVHHISLNKRDIH